MTYSGEAVPKLSVLIPTYNHEKFIAQTLDGVLMQKTDFPFEIVIGDDASKDGNAAIIAKYAEKHPEIFRAFLHPENLGPSNPRELGGKNNVAFLFEKCRGEYIALCEGDDFWTDPLKLQKQVDFLSKNPEYALTHHQLEVIYEDNTPSHPFNTPEQAHNSSLEDLFRDETWFLGTASTVFRNVFKNGMTDWWWKSASGDLGIFIQVAKTGKIRFIPETMGAYRKHQGGMTNIHTPRNLFFLKNRMEMFEAINLDYGPIYSEIINRTVQKYQRLIQEIEEHLS